jgi:predicted DNA-binding protein (MmcQ/YjbR family)
VVPSAAYKPMAAQKAKASSSATKKRKAPTNPDEAALRDLGMTFPETTEEFPWDHRALKVKGKVFVFMGTGAEAGADHDQFFISCKLPASHPIALTLPGVKPTGYGLGKSGWVSAQYPPGKAPVDMLKEWIRESYCAVAPKKLAAQVDGAGANATSTTPTTKTKTKTNTTAKKKSAAKSKPTVNAKAKAKAKTKTKAKTPAKKKTKAKRR